MESFHVIHTKRENIQPHTLKMWKTVWNQGLTVDIRNA